MNIRALRKWLDEPRDELTEAVKHGILEQVRTIESRGTVFYGYALLPGESHEIADLTAATNSEDRIPVPRTHESYRYYRYAVHEWANREPEGFARANDLLREANRQFDSIRGNDVRNPQADAFEEAHADLLLLAVLRGFEAAKSAGAFGRKKRFLAMWNSDSNHPIVFESVRLLNPQKVVEEFFAEFG